MFLPDSSNRLIKLSPLSLFHQSPTRCVSSQCSVSLMAVVYPVHILNRVEVTHDVSGTKGVPRFHRLAVNLFNHDDDVPGPLAAPRLIDHGRFKR